MWSGPRVDKWLYLMIILLISVLENGGHSACQYKKTSSRSCKLIGLSWAEL